MYFDIGDHLVYPLHGAGTVVGIVEKDGESGKSKLYEIEFPFDRLKLTVPAESASAVGLRPVVSEAEAVKLMDYIKNKVPEKNTLMWNKRQKEDLAALRTGDIYKAADVYKSLARKERMDGLSSGEKKMLTCARNIIFSEIHFAGNMEMEQIEALFSELVK